MPSTTTSKNNKFNTELLNLMRTRNVRKFAAELEKNHDNIDILDSSGNNLLHHTIITNNINVIQDLAKNKADINAKNSAGDTALHLAVNRYLDGSYNCEYAVYHLIRNGADINIPDSNNKTPIDLLYQKLIGLFKDEKKLEYLIKNWNIIGIEEKVRLDRRIQDYISAFRILKNPQKIQKSANFYELSKQGNLKEIREFLTKESDLIIDDNLLGGHLLSGVITSPEIERTQKIEIIKIMTEILLLNGRKINEHEKFILLTALDKAISAFQPDIGIITLLVKTLADAKINTNDYKLIEIPWTIDNNVVLCSRLRNPFILASNYDIDMLKKLAEIFQENGFNITDLINIHDQFDKTPLHYAVENGKAEIISFFIDNGAKLNSKNNNHKTPADLLYHKLIEILVKKDLVNKLIKDCEKTNQPINHPNEELIRIYIKMRELEKDTENVKKSSSKFEMIKDIIKRVINSISGFFKKIFDSIIEKSRFTNSENKKGNTSSTISSPTRDSSNLKENKNKIS